MANKNKIRVAVDWDDRGVPSFWQQEDDPLNLIPHSSHLTQLGNDYGSSTTEFIYYPHEIFETTTFPEFYAPYLKALNPFGAQVNKINIEPSSSVVFGFLSEGTIPVEHDTDYTVWLWLSTESGDDWGTDGMRLQWATYTMPYSIEDSGFEDVTPYPSTDQTVVAFPVHISNTNGDFVQIIIGNNAVGAAHVLYVWGMMMVEGSDEEEPIWNPGGEHGHLNDITNYVTMAQGSIGKTSWETILPDEGTLSLSLNNNSRMFSPEYVDSPLFGVMKPYLRVWVLISDSEDNWHMLWSGWTHQFSLVAGLYENKVATLTARQGKYNIEAQEPSSLDAQENKTSKELIASCFAGGYLFPTGGDDPNFVEATIIQEAEDGLTVPLFGTDFVGTNRQDTAKHLQELQNLAEINGNYLFLSRYGRVIFKTFDTVKDLELDEDDELPYSKAHNAEYVHSPLDLYRQIIINYDVYENADDIEMQGHDETIYSGASDFPFEIHPQYNNKPLIGDVVLDVSAFLPIDYSAVPSGGTANASFIEHNDGIYTWFNALSNNSTDLDYRLSLVSRDSGYVWYASEIGKTLTLVGDPDRALDTLTYTNPLITNDDMAADFGQMQANRRTGIVAWFSNITFTNKDDETSDLIVNKTVGDVVWIAEEQSGNVPKHSIIIGESFNYTPTFMQMTYSLAPTGGEVLVVAFTWDADELTVDFTDRSLSTPNPDYLWDFGD